MVRFFLPSTWQELLLEEDRNLAHRQDEIVKEEEELEKKRKLSPDDQRRRDEKWKVLEDQRTELESEMQKHRAQGLQEIARRVSKDRVRGIFDKDVLVYENERVVLLVDGAIQRILGPGVYTVGGLMRDVKTGAILSKIKLGHSESVDVIFVNLADMDIRWGFPQELWTQDGLKVGAHGIIRMKISEPDIPKLFANMMDMTAQRIRVEDLRGRIGLELLGSVIAPVMKSYKIDDLWGNKAVIEDCYNGIETDMRKTLSRWGFELIQITINYNFPEVWLKRKESMATRPLQLAEQIDESIKYRDEFWRASFVAEQGREALTKQFAHESNLTDIQYGHETDVAKQRNEQESRLLDLKNQGDVKQQEIANQELDLTKAQKRQEFEMARDRGEFEQGLSYKQQLDKANLDRENARAQLQQSTNTARVQLEETQRDGQHRRNLETVRAEHEGRAQTLQVLAQSGSADAIAKGLEMDTLRTIAERGGTAEAAEAIRSRYSLQTHEDSESKAYKVATDLFNVAKPAPASQTTTTVAPPKDEDEVDVTVKKVAANAGALTSPSPSRVQPATQTGQSFAMSRGKVEASGKTCPHCNASNLAIAKFCTVCGLKI